MLSAGGFTCLDLADSCFGTLCSLCASFSCPSCGLDCKPFSVSFGAEPFTALSSSATLRCFFFSCRLSGDRCLEGEGDELRELDVDELEDEDEPDDPDELDELDELEGLRLRDRFLLSFLLPISPKIPQPRHFEHFRHFIWQIQSVYLSRSV